MFTQRLISLSHYATLEDLQVIRDCSFSYVGKIPSRASPRIVPCTEEAHVKTATGYAGISGVIVPSSLTTIVPAELGLAVSKAPIATAYALHEKICFDPEFLWTSFPTQIDSTAVIHPTAYVAPQDVIIGPDSVIHPNAVILPRTMIGIKSTIGPGTVVGCDAFEVNTTVSPISILSQAGGVKIGNNVDIQAKCTIVRATFGGFTEIGDETKLDCQVHLAHDCFVGKRVRIAACAEISGRVTINDGCFIGPNASLSNGVDIGENVHVTIGAVVTRNIPPGMTVSGHFAVEHSQWIAFMRSIR